MSANADCILEALAQLDKEVRGIAALYVAGEAERAVDLLDDLAIFTGEIRADIARAAARERKT